MNLYNHYKTTPSPPRGAVLPELAIVLPVALAFLLFMYWYFITISWRNALRDAVVTAVDVAQSRGNAVVMGKRTSNQERNDPSGVIEPIDQYHVGRLGIPAILAGTESNPEATYNAYLLDPLGWTPTQQGGADVELTDFHAQNLYAMAYAYEIVRARIGGSLKYPCDPNPADPADGQGCLICTPPAMSVIATPRGQLYGVQCTMQPVDVLLSPIFRILGGLGAQPIIISFTAVDSVS